MTAEGTPRRKGRTLRRWLALPLAAGFMLALAAPAHATFPGNNGKIAGQVIVGSGSDISINIETVDADGSNPTALTADGAGVVNAAPEWSPDGTKIVFQSSRDSDINNPQLHTMDADGSNRVNLNVTGVTPAWSSDGSKVVYRAGGDLWTVNPDGTGATQLTTVGTQLASPDWSPDGGTIVAKNSYGIFLVNPTTGVVTPLVGQADTAAYFDPEWSPDGSKVFYQRNGFGTPTPGSDVWSINPDGTGAVVLTGANPAFDGYPAPSPDGTKVAYRRGGSTFLMNPDGSGPTFLSATPQQSLDWQPLEAPGLEPINIAKTTLDTGVEGKWAWKMGKWTTSKLEQKAKGPRPYSFRVLVDSHGFKIRQWRVASRVTLTNPNDVPINGTLTDVLPGFSCTELGGVHPTPVQIPANGNLQLTTLCTTGADPGGPVTNTATFTLDEAHEEGPQPVSDQATTTIDKTPPPNSPGQKVALRDPMWHNGKKVLRYLDAVNGPWSITASYTVKLIPPVTPGKCWWHHNTAHLFDVKTAKKVRSSNRVSVYICRPKDAPKGTPPKDLPKTDKHGIPIVTPRLGGPKSIPATYRTRLRTKLMAPRRVFRGQAFRVKVTTKNTTRKKAFGTIVKVKIPNGLRLASKQRGITTKGRYAYWTTKVLRPKRKLTRTLRLVAIRPGAKRIVAISNARNAKRSKAKKVVRVLRPRRDLS